MKPTQFWKGHPYPLGATWAEWNGKYRDTLRRYWKGDPGLTSDFAYRLCGSSALYQASTKTPAASINFVTSHDGFSLRDLVSFNQKHNDANAEDNKDGAGADTEARATLHRHRGK